MRIYLDIDGTLIHDDVRNYGRPAFGLEQFLSMLKYHDAYWLTTHCCDGDATAARNILKGLVDSKYYDVIDSIKPTVWGTQKVEGIDWVQEFIWLDDDITQSEQVKFHRTMSGQNVIEMDLAHNPEQLMEITEDLRKLSKVPY